MRTSKRPPAAARKSDFKSSTVRFVVLDAPCGFVLAELVLETEGDDRAEARRAYLEDAGGVLSGSQLRRLRPPPFKPVGGVPLRRPRGLPGVVPAGVLPGRGRGRGRVRGRPVSTSTLGRLFRGGEPRIRAAFAAFAARRTAGGAGVAVAGGAGAGGATVGGTPAPPRGGQDAAEVPFRSTDTLAVGALCILTLEDNALVRQSLRQCATTFKQARSRLPGVPWDTGFADVIAEAEPGQREAPPLQCDRLYTALDCVMGQLVQLALIRTADPIHHTSTVSFADVRVVGVLSS